MTTPATAEVRDLGTLSRGPRTPVKMDFGWFGERIRVAEGAGDVPLIAFLTEAQHIDVGDEVGVNLAVHRFLQRQVHPEDWDRFLKLAGDNNQNYNDLMQVAKDIVAAVARFPTGRPGDSSAGPSSTGGSSKPGSQSIAQQAMVLAKGRPDIKRIIWQTQLAEHQQKRKATMTAGERAAAAYQEAAESN